MRGIGRFRIRIPAPEELLHRILYRRNDAGVPVHEYKEGGTCKTDW
jgi:hypothetical protein